MPAEQGVIGVFAEPTEAAGAIRALRDAGFRDIHAAMPAPFPDVLAALEMPKSGVGLGVLLGTLVGLTGGLVLCITTSLAWPLTTGGKPIVSLPAFMVIGFEAAVLVGGTLLHGVLAWTTVAGRWGRRPTLEDPRFSADRIGILALGDSAALEPMMRKAGAEEVRRVG
jgi:hypothetical protein